MVTKLLTALVMSGALWVAGDAAYQRFDCCSTSVKSCHSAPATKSDDCCDVPSNCCSAKKTPKKSCCSE